MAEPPIPLRTRLAGRYDVERELGEGGMATVYVAEDVRHGRKVAIKVFRPEVAAALGTDRFLAEFKTTARLQYPHIFGLIGSGVVESDDSAPRPFDVMPLVNGETLRSTREGSRAAARRSRRCIRVRARAWSCSPRHQARERPPRTGARPMVTDFGIAKADRSRLVYP